MKKFEHKYRKALYLSGYVHPNGDISDPIFIREVKEMAASEIPKDCYIIDEVWDGVYWESIGDEIHSTRKPQEWLDGDFGVAWYYNNLKYGNPIELFWCEIISINYPNNGEYAKCQLYFGEEFNISKKYILAEDVCINDIERIQF